MNAPMSSPALPTPSLVPALDLQVDVAAPIEVGDVGHGQRRLIPINGGTAQAAAGRGGWQARVLPGGADFQLIVAGRSAQLDARYVLETDAGDRIFVVNQALRSGPPELVARLARGEPVDPALIYFRCVPRFEVAAASLAWLTERLFIGTGARWPAQVTMRFFEVG